VTCGGSISVVPERGSLTMKIGRTIYRPKPRNFAGEQETDRR
jgi:hypothetical protein